MHAHEYEASSISNSQYTQYDGGTQWPTATEPDAEGFGEVVQSLRSWAHYQHDVYVFHTKFLNDSTHPYSSKPAGWLLLNRPVGVDAQNDIKPGVQGCAAPADSTCQRQVLLLGNPVIWWGGCLALLWGLLQWVGARDWRYGVALVGVASTWLPWLRYDDRPIFLFYAVATLPFLVLALTLALGQLIGADRATLTTAHRRRGRGRLLHGPDDPGLRVVLADLDRRAAHPRASGSTGCGSTAGSRRRSGPTGSPVGPPLVVRCGQLAQTAYALWPPSLAEGHRPECGVPLVSGVPSEVDG